MKTPPHLPSKTCSVSMHRKAESIIYLFVVVLISFLSGITATLVTAAWIIPSYTPNTVIYSVDSSDNTASGRVVDPLFLRQQEKQLVGVYDKREMVDGGFFTTNARVGTGVILTSDGWLAMYLPSVASGEHVFWEVVDYKGGVYEVEEFVFDAFADVVYFKVNGDGFFASSFAPKEYTKSFAFLWAVHDDDWQSSLLGDLVRTGDESVHPIWEPQFAHNIFDTVLSRSVLLSEDGKLVGFASDTGELVPSFFVEEQYTKIFDEKKASYHGISIDGYMVDGFSEEGEWKDLFGFYVTRSGTRPTIETIGVGDVIVRIQGRAVDEVSLGEQILSAPEEFEVTVLRERQEIDIMISKEILIIR